MRGMPFMPYMLFGRVSEVAKSIDNGIAANTIRRLMIINANPSIDLCSHAGST